MTNHWLDKTEYPFAPNYFEVNGQQLHYIDEGQGQTILFVHGTPSWSFDFRHLKIKFSLPRHRPYWIWPIEQAQRLRLLNTKPQQNTRKIY